MSRGEEMLGDPRLGGATAPPGELLAATGISKTFGRMQALKGVDLVLRAGEVHALVGANGAGKSTLSRILCGHLLADEGEIRVRSTTVQFATPRDALTAGVAMVTQETTLAPDLPVIENVFLQRMGSRGPLSRRALANEADAIIADLDIALGFSLFDRVGDLSIAERQLVEVLKALAGDPAIIFFDEPTTSLSPYESARLFEMLSVLSGRGKAIVLVSHRMEEIFQISDQITVLREGRIVGSGIESSKLSPGSLVNLMVGKEISDLYARNLKAHPTATGKPILRVSNLSAPPLVKEVSFDIAPGEILGLAGLVGAGRSEVAEAIYGLCGVEGGSIEFEGRPYRPRAAIDALNAGLGFVGEDRRRQGIVPDLSVMENLLLSKLGMHRRFRWSSDAENEHAVQIAQSLGLSLERLQDPNLLFFSGGMQQKIIIARSLSTDPRLLLLDEPTRGVDIETRSAIYRAVRERTSRGLAVLWVSSDFEELLGICDRVIVMSDGRSVADLSCHDLDVEKLMMFAAPKSSSNAVSVVLEQVAARFGGAAFWVYLDGARVYCFDSVGSVNGAALLMRGTVLSIEELGFGAALKASEHQFAVDIDGGRQITTVPMTTRRGHYFGHFGLALPAATDHPPREVIVGLVQAAMANL